MGEHLAPWYAIGGSRRERCPYGGGTVIDAQRRITPLMRRTQAFIVRRCLAQKREMTLNERALLGERNMLSETLEMIKAGDKG